MWVRTVCVLGLEDLPWMRNRPELFVNKLHFNFEPLTLDCLEELMFNRTIAGDLIPFDNSYYKRLPIVKQRFLINLPGHKK